MKSKQKQQLLKNLKEVCAESKSLCNLNLNYTEAKMAFKYKSIWGQIYLKKQYVLTIYLTFIKIDDYHGLSYKAYYKYLFIILLKSWGLTLD